MAVKIYGSNRIDLDGNNETFSIRATTDDELNFYKGANTKLMGMDASGFESKPNIPAFHVYTTGDNYSVPTSATVYNANNIKYNIGNFYDSTNKRATAPIAGLYHFQFFVNAYSASGQRLYIRFILNGSFTYHPTIGYIGNASDTTYGGTMQLKLEAGDYIEAKWNVTGSGTASNGEAYSGFLGYLIG